jgi:hypothetical protein
MYGLLGTNMKKSRSGPVLAKDQLWKVNDRYIHVVELGKTLIHYKMSNGRQQRGLPVKMSAIETVQEYLKSNRAVLVKA